MRLREVTKDKILKEYYDPEEDNYDVIEIDHVRRPRITLKHLQKLRMIRYIEDLEYQQMSKDANRIYGQQGGEEA